MKPITAQEARACLSRKGWYPLAIAGLTEFWLDGRGHYVGLIYDGKLSEKTPLLGTRHILFGRARNGRVVASHRGLRL